MLREILNHMKPLTLLLCICMATGLFAQKTISGVVSSGSDHRPLYRASVYIDGSSKSTYTDANGKFSLQTTGESGQLIVSHIGYLLYKTDISSHSPATLNVVLTEKATSLSEVTVQGGKSRRKENMKIFLPAFLGDDNFGRKARILNEEVLRLTHRYDTLVNPQNKTRTITEVLTVQTNSPLEVELPLTGYHLFLDLSFWEYRKNFISIDVNSQAYYRFAPIVAKNAGQQKKFERFRKEAYYNSAKHFCRSLYRNQLRSNGFAVNLYLKDSAKANAFVAGRAALTVPETDTVFHDPNANRFDFENFFIPYSYDEKVIYHLKGGMMKIKYYDYWGDGPLDLEQKRKPDFDAEKYHNSNDDSYMICLSDTCIVRSNGTTPGRQLMFLGKITRKRFGALLPDDYEPPVATSADLEKQKDE
ncbi:MAG: hypothetical protein RIS29_261 [Bacteroidota bacterium]